MVRFMSGLIALILGGGSAAMSVLFALSMPGGEWVVRIWVAVAVGACLAKMTFPAAWQGKTWRKSALLRASFAIALIIDSSFTGGFIATTRDSFTSELATKAHEREVQEKTVAKAKTDLDAAPIARAIEIIEADLASARRLTKGCKPGTNEAKSETCAGVAVLEREQANVEVRARLKAEYEDAQAKFDKMPEVIVYPEAHRLAKTLRTIGLEWATDERVSLFLSGLLVLFFELGSVAAARSALQPGPQAPSAPDLPAPRSAPAAVTPRRQTPRGKGGTDYSPAVLSALRDADSGKPIPGVQKDATGVLHLSQRALHQHLKVPQRALSAALASLETTGRAQIARGPGGTAVKLLGKLAAVP